MPVFLYGALAGGRTRAELRRGGPDELARRMRDGELRARLRPARAAPDRRRDARRRAAAARRLQRRARRRRRRWPTRWASPRACARAAPQGCPACARSASSSPRAAARRRSRSTSRTTSASSLAEVVEAIARHAHDRRGRARRPRAGGGVRGLPRGRPRSQPPHDRRGSRLYSSHGPDEAQAPDQAPRQRRRHHRGARAHRAQADRRRAQGRHGQATAAQRREERMSKPPTWARRGPARGVRDGHLRRRPAGRVQGARHAASSR